RREVLGLNGNLACSTCFERFGRTFDRCEDDAELHADLVDVLRAARFVLRVALDGNAIEAHEQSGDGAVGLLHDLAERVLEHHGSTLSRGSLPPRTPSYVGWVRPSHEAVRAAKLASGGLRVVRD